MARSLADAKKQVAGYIEPRGCFVWYKDSSEGYIPIPGTPCAHYVAHQIGMTRLTKRDAACDAGYLLRVQDLVTRLGDPIDAATVQPGDVWARLKHGRMTSGGREPSSHCGMVASVVREGNGAPRITIKHCSSGQRLVAENDWARYFNSGGAFYRLPARAESAETHANLERLIRGFDYRMPFDGMS